MWRSWKDNIEFLSSNLKDRLIWLPERNEEFYDLLKRVYIRFSEGEVTDGDCLRCGAKPERQRKTKTNRGRRSRGKNRGGSGGGRARRGAVAE